MKARGIPTPEDARTESYLILAACDRWKILPWDFAKLEVWQQIVLKAWEELRTIESMPPPAKGK